MMPSKASTTTFTFLLVKKELKPTSLRADLYAAYCEQQTEIRLLNIRIADLKATEEENAAKFISFDQYKADLLLRWGVHVKETTALGCDMTKAFKWLKVQFASLKSLSLRAE